MRRFLIEHPKHELENIVVVMGPQVYKTHRALLYELAFPAARSVSGQCCEVKECRAWLVVTQALEQGRQGSCAHAGYHQNYNIDNFMLKKVFI